MLREAQICSACGAPILKNHPNECQYCRAMLDPIINSINESVFQNNVPMYNGLITSSSACYQSWSSARRM